MDEPEIGKYPTELFGHPYTEYAVPGQARDDMENQRCPFIGSECIKFRKSEPSVKIGTCSLGMMDPESRRWLPSVTCPKRLHLPELYRALKRMVFGDAPVTRLAEVRMERGSFDSVFVKCDEAGEVADFCCVELQANGTTGTPWDGVMDIKRNGRYGKDGYGYGFNLANQYQKTMMQQVYKKGLIAEAWDKHLIFLLQDSGMAYLRRSLASDMAGMELNDSQTMSDRRFIHFAVFTMKWAVDRWVPRITALYDTTALDVRDMLGSKPRKQGEGYKTFVDTLRGRLPGDLIE